jgi:hypothetical protein
MGWTKRGVERIDKLTPSQQAKLIHFREKWNSIALSTKSFDISRAIAGVQCFAEAWGVKGLDDEIYETTSPADGWREGGDRWDNNQNFYTLSRSLWGARVWLTRAFSPPVIRFVIETIAIEQGIVRPLRLLNLAPGRKFGDLTRYIQYGQFDASWLAVVDFFATVFDNEHCRKFNGLMQAVSSCGFIWIRPDRVVFCDRPEIAKYDDRGRLHCEDGPALKYRDGYTHYALHGVPVPEKYIETPADQINFADVIKEPNGAVRMAVIEKFGFRRLMDTTRHRRISEANGNSLLEFTITAAAGKRYSNPTLRFRLLHLKWHDKMGSKETLLPVPRLARQFGEDCPDNVNDCEQVRRWTLGWPRDALAIAET